MNIYEWLKKLNLVEYQENFENNGYTHFEAFKKDYAFFPTIYDDLLKRFGIYKYGHRLRIMMGLREGKEDVDRLIMIVGGGWGEKIGIE